MSEQRITFDRRHIGHVFPSFTVAVEAARIRFFARVTGQTDPVYFDEAAARAAGHASPPVPVTFIYCLEAEGSTFEPMFELLGADNRELLHAEQAFRYFAVPCAGSTLSFAQWVDDIYEKKGGALQFAVRKTRVTNARRELVAEMRNVIVLANG